ncbi:hypothetical protein An01g09430 [Aspergillus niger]|uniref:Uncharacterized protein n=2 Tax=Aspergillus niger TaxID=5061 RepID=A2Q9X4_ASPNC|nr:hypothetical protein An01g09430 [Aspergillus niger]CAK43993.1 hypothetical protein An01g09430 [Aspergillus niger]
MEKKEGGRKGYPTSGQQYPVHMAQDSIPVDPPSVGVECGGYLSPTYTIYYYTAQTDGIIRGVCLSETKDSKYYGVDDPGSNTITAQNWGTCWLSEPHDWGARLCQWRTNAFWPAHPANPGVAPQAFIKASSTPHFGGPLLETGCQTQGARQGYPPSVGDRQVCRVLAGQSESACQDPWILCRQRKEALAPADEEDDDGVSRERRMKGIAEISTLHPYHDHHQEPAFSGANSYYSGKTRTIRGLEQCWKAVLAVHSAAITEAFRSGSTEQGSLGMMLPQASLLKIQTRLVYARYTNAQALWNKNVFASCILPGGRGPRKHGGHGHSDFTWASSLFQFKFRNGDLISEADTLFGIESEAANAVADSRHSRSVNGVVAGSPLRVGATRFGIEADPCRNYPDRQHGLILIIGEARSLDKRVSSGNYPQQGWHTSPTDSNWGLQRAKSEKLASGPV